MRKHGGVWSGHATMGYLTRGTIVNMGMVLGDLGSCASTREPCPGDRLVVR